MLWYHGDIHSKKRWLRVNQASLALEPPLSCDESPHPTCCAAIWSQTPSLTLCRSDTAKPTPNPLLPKFLLRKKPKNNNKTQQQQTKTKKKPHKARIKDHPNPKGQNFGVWRSFCALMISYALHGSQFLIVQVKSS